MISYEFGHPSPPHSVKKILKKDYLGRNAFQKKGGGSKFLTE